METLRSSASNNRVARRSVLVRVPASTSNLGSGFDTLGLALGLYHFIRVTRRRGRGVTLASPVVYARLCAQLMPLRRPKHKHRVVESSSLNQLRKQNWFQIIAFKMH